MRDFRAEGIGPGTHVIVSRSRDMTNPSLAVISALSANGKIEAVGQQAVNGTVRTWAVNARHKDDTFWNDEQIARNAVAVGTMVWDLAPSERIKIELNERMERAVTLAENCHEYIEELKAWRKSVDQSIRMFKHHRGKKEDKE